MVQALLFHALRLWVKLRMLIAFMELYTPPYILLFVAGATLQAGCILYCRQKCALPFVVPLLGAGAVLASAWLEHDIVLAFGQVFLLCVLWRVTQERKHREKTEEDAHD